MPPIRLVVFDWAGTTIDFGSLAPLEAFLAVFAANGVRVTHEEARLPMGLHKKDHLRVMLQLPEVTRRWREVHGRDWSEGDFDAIYHDLVPRQMESLESRNGLIDTVVPCVAQLRQRGILVAGTTGYFRAAADRVAELARMQGYVPDANLCADDVPTGRPAPWMIFRIMEQLGVYPPTAVVKVGDTRVDIEEGLNAGVWSVGVTESSSEVGLKPDELADLPNEERRLRLATAEQCFRDAGAHAIIENLAHLPNLIDKLSTISR